jgi:hypothetical protein
MVLAVALARIPPGATARLVGTTLVLAGLMLVTDRATEDRTNWGCAVLGGKLLVGSLLSGAFALLFLVAFYPKPWAGNLAWMLGIPALVAIGQRHRNLVLVVPYTVFGWLGFALLGWVLRVPVD